MENQVVEIDGDLVCLLHHRPITIVIQDKNIPFMDTLLCQRCLEQRRTILRNSMSLNAVLETIKQGYEVNQQSQYMQESLNLIMEFQQKTTEFETIYISLFQQLSRTLQDWIDSILQIGTKQFNQNQLQELQNYYENNFNITQQKDRYLKDINLSILSKVEKIYQRIIDNSFKHCFNSFKKLENNSEEKQTDIIQSPKIYEDIPQTKIGKLDLSQQQLKLVKETQIIQVCAIAFNQQGNIMVSGYNNDIKVWQFQDGYLEEKQSLSGHLGIVSCLVFSQRQNWFFSGGYDQAIHCWKETQQSTFMNCFPLSWNQNGPETLHCQRISQIIINNNEDEVISCSQSYEKSIIVWKPNCKNNNLTFKSYIFDQSQKYSSWTTSISFNKSETYLISNNDKYLTLWKRGNNGNWTFCSFLQINGIVNMLFIGEMTVAYVLQNSKQLSRVSVVKSQEGISLSQMQGSISLNHFASNSKFFQNTQNLFFNKTTSIVFCRQNNQIYVLRKEGGKLIKIKQLQFNIRDENIWTLSQDNDFLIFWNSFKNEFEIEKFDYH